MGTFYEISQDYRLTIDVLFESAKRITRILFSKVETFHLDDQNHSISFETPTPPRGATHGEKITIELTQTEEITTISVKSESLIKEFDCGQNRTNVEIIFGELNRLYKQRAVSEPKKNTTTTRKIMPFVFAVALIATLILLFQACGALIGGCGSNKDDTCGICGGTGVFQGERCWCIGRD